MSFMTIRLCECGILLLTLALVSGHFVNLIITNNFTCIDLSLTPTFDKHLCHPELPSVVMLA